MNSSDIIILDKENNEIFILLNENKIKVEIIRRKRKSISIKIEPKDKVYIITPKSVPLYYLKDILINKQSWILKTLDKFKYIDEDLYHRNYEDGDIFYYLGKEYKLKVIIDNDINSKKRRYCYISIHSENLIIETNDYDKETVKETLKYWYKLESEKIVQDRIEYLKKQNHIFNKLIPDTVKIKEQRKRWGSCTSNKKIYINSKISMARIDVIDYIIVHEFCHLVHMNHSKDFYNLVKVIMPSYKESELWLKENGYKLII